MAFKRMVALVLSIIMIVGALSVFAACAEQTPSVTTGTKQTQGDPATTTKPSDTTAGGDPVGTTGPVTTTKPSKIDHDLPEIDLEGDVISFVVADTDQDMLNTSSIVADADTGDTVDQAIYERNERIQEQFNCTIELYEEYVSDYSVSGQYGTVLLAGESSIDIIAGRQWDDMNLCLKGYVQELTSLEGTENDYIDWEKGYWATDYIEGMNYGDKVYWLVGDINLRYTGSFYTVFLNKTLYDTSCLATYGDPYQLVYNGDWHYDTIIALAQLGWQDIGEEQDKTDSGDVLGLAIPLWDNTNAMVISAGIPFSTENPDGSIVLNITDKNERLVNFCTKFSDLLSTNGVLSFGGAYGDAMNLLASDNAMMVFGRLNQAHMYLRDMASDYVILPYPKLDKTQDRYYSSVHDGISIFGVNNATSNLKAALVVLEAMACESYNTVRLEYYDYALKYKYTRDDYAADMIDYIASVAWSDFGYVWAFTNSSLGSFFRGALQPGLNKNNFARLVKQGQRGWQIALGDIMDDFKELWASEAN